MQSRISNLTALALGALLVATPLAAQDPAAEADAPDAVVDTPAAEAPAEETPAAPADAAPAPAPDAAPAPAAAPPEPQIDIQTFGDWELRCETSTRNCFMYQLARDEQQNPVSEISIVALPEENEAAVGVTAITPLGTDLTQGVVMQIDNAQARQYPFNWCTRSGCYARFGLTDAELSAMRAGNRALVRIVSISAPEQPVMLSFSLSGFTAAHAALTSPE